MPLQREDIAQLQDRFAKAYALAQQGSPTEAAREWRAMLHGRTPGDVGYHDLRYNLAWQEFSEGHIAQGLTFYIESGRVLGFVSHAKRQYPGKRLEAPFKGKTILLSHECGAGDELLRARFARLLKERGAARVVWATDSGLAPLLRRVAGIDQVLTPQEVLAAQYDEWTTTLELPLMLGLTPQDVAAEPYLTPDPLCVERWRRRLGGSQGLKIGIRWKGEQGRDQSQGRSVPLAPLVAALAGDGVHLYSLQRDWGHEDLAGVEGVEDLGKDFATWEDTAAVVSLMDVVVTSDTSIAHLAAALGKETLVLTPPFAYYAWVGHAGHTPWYPTARVFCQQKPGDWSVPLAAVRAGVAELLSMRGPMPREMLAQYPFGTVPMRVHPDAELISTIVRTQGWYSRRDLGLYDVLLGPGDSFVDGGANIGWYSIYAAHRVGPTGCVVAVEPEPRNADLLEHNTRALRPTVEVVRAALGASEGRASLQLSQNNFGDHYAVADGTGPVPVVALDSILARLPNKPRLIKLDIQGSENFALDGMREYVRGHRPTLLVEFAPGLMRRAGDQWERFLDFIQTHGYLAARVNDDYGPGPLLQPLSPDMLKAFARKVGDTDEGWDILLLTPQEYERLRLQLDPFVGAPRSVVGQANELARQGREAEAYAAVADPAVMEDGVYSRRAHKLLREGRFLDAFAEMRKEERFGVLVHLGERRYEAGLPLLGKRVYVIAQGGYGDAIMAARFYELLAQRGAQVIVGTHPGLPALFARLPASVMVRERSTVRPHDYDYWMTDSVAELVVALGLTHPLQGVTYPYLSADRTHAPTFVRELDTRGAGRPSIGIRWSGLNPPKWRDIPPQELLALAPLGVLVSLQVGEGEVLDEQHGVYAPQLSTWEDTAALIQRLDYVVTSCTSVAHLAGAMGKKTALLVHLDPYFPWLGVAQGGLSPWYPSIRVFPQPAAGDWRGAVAAAYSWIEGDLHTLWNAK